MSFVTPLNVQITEQNFSIIKAVAFAFAFLTGTTIQFFWPYRKAGAALVHNWKINFALAAINVAVMSFICASCVCSFAVFVDSRQWGLANALHLSKFARIPLTILALDAVAYSWHRANHQFPILWRFHAVHHSDAVFDTSTAVRFHLGELLASLGVRLFIVLVLGLSIEGILFFEIVYQFFNVFEHGNTAIPIRFERALSTLFVTPGIHRKHHSINKVELNSNYGTIFSIWDRAFATYRQSDSSEQIEVGLMAGKPAPSLKEVLAMPMVRQP